MIMSDVNDDTLAEMDKLVAEGVPDFKLFTAYPGVFYSPDDHIFRAMQQTAKNGGLIMMHAENGPAIDVVAAQLVAEGKTDPYYHGVARYPIFEGEATNRVIRLAEAAGVPVYIVHLSVMDALDAVRDARDRGVQAFAETCPQYLFLSLDDLGNGFEGAKFVCSPPLREKDPQLGGALDRPREGRPPGRVDRPLPVRLPRPEGARPGRLPQDPQRAAGRRGPRRPAPRRRRGRGPDQRASAGSRSSRPSPREAVRDVPAQGRDRRRRRRGPRRLRPEPEADDQRGDATTWTSTTRATRAGRSRARPTSCSAAGPWSSATASSPARKGHGRFLKRAPADYARLA